jgi:hypothetical protein
MGSTYIQRISQKVKSKNDECLAKKHRETEGVGIVCTLFMGVGLRGALK